MKANKTPALGVMSTVLANPETHQICAKGRTHRVVR